MIAIAGPYGVDYVKDQGITQQVVVDSSKAQRYDDWVDDPNLRFSYTMFNVTNPFEIIEEGAAPVVAPMGPYVYILNQHRFNIEFDDAAGTVSFNQWQHYEFSPELSGEGVSDVDDQVTLLNPALQSMFPQAYMTGKTIFPTAPENYVILILGQVVYGSYDCETSDQGCIKEPPVFTSMLNTNATGSCEGYSSMVREVVDCTDFGTFAARSVSDWLWGYESDLLAQVNSFMGQMPTRFPGLQHNMTQETALETLGGFELKTGAKDRDDVQTFIQWNNYSGVGELEACLLQPCDHKQDGTEGHNFYPAWGSDEANTVMGTTGQQFSPGVDDDDTFTVWQFPLYRSAPIEYSGEDVELKGITLKRFRYPDWIWQSATDGGAAAENAGWYGYGPDGTQNQTSIQYGIPIFMTKPGFAGCDEEDPLFAARPAGGAAWDDFCCSNDDCDGGELEVYVCDQYLDIEPTTGLTMHTHQGSQINTWWQRPPKMDYLWPNATALDVRSADANDYGVFVPTFVADPFGEVSDDDADQFKSQMSLASTMRSAVQWVGYPLAGICLVTGYALLRRAREEDAARRAEAQGALYAVAGDEPLLKA